MTFKYTDDDYCDIYENKICDNCGKCLEINGIDTKAIKIEDIAKTQEENELLEEEFLNELKSNLDEEDLNEIEKENLNLQDIYKRFINNKTDFDNIPESSDNEEYEDAFEHIEYLDEVDSLDDLTLEEKTEEIYPGVRRVKKA
jgi:Na+-translocating ferredoxin:NAD+ oxidoreductase RnfC subunit